MASRYKGYWKCDYRGKFGPHWTEYYYVRTSAEWYYYSRTSKRWEMVGGVRQTFRSYMGYNMDPYVNVDGDRTFRKILPLEIVLVCGKLCRRKKSGKRKRVSCSP
jgi:hypothetical protein